MSLWRLRPSVVLAFFTFAETLEDADTMPTTQQLALYKSLHDKLQVQLALWSALN